MAKPRICRRELVIDRLTPVPQGWFHWSHCYGPRFPTYHAVAGLFIASHALRRAMQPLWREWGPAGLDILPLPTFVQYFLLVLFACPSPLSAPPRHFTRVRGWPPASPRKGRLIPLGQGSSLPLCIQPPAPLQPWTGLCLPCCSLCCFSSRAMEFAGHLRSREVSGELSGQMRGVGPLPPCH